MVSKKSQKSQIKKEIIALASNKSVNELSGYYTKGSFGRVPSKSSGLKWETNVDGCVYDIYELFKDTTFSSCHDARIIGAFANGYKFFGNKQDIKTLEDMRFDEQITRLFGELVTFNLLFAQVLTKEGKLSQVRTYDTPTMDFSVDERNNIVGFYQIINSPPLANTNSVSRQYWDAIPATSLNANAQDNGQQFVFFNQEEMFHYSVNNIDSSLFPTVTAATLYRAVRIKFLILEYMTFVFSENDFQTTVNLPSMSNKDKTVFMRNLIDSKRDKRKKLILEGMNVELKDRKDMQFFTYLIELWSTMDNEILKGMKCKRIEATTGSEGRADNVVVSQFVSLRVKKDQRDIKNILEQQIFKRGKIDVEIVFQVGEELEKVNIQNLSTLASIHPVKLEKMEEYLKDRGVIIPEGFFDKEAQENILQNKAEKNGPQNESRRSLDNKASGAPQKLVATREQAKDENLDKIFRKNE